MLEVCQCMYRVLTSSEVHYRVFVIISIGCYNVVLTESSVWFQMWGSRKKSEKLNKVHLLTS